MSSCCEVLNGCGVSPSFHNAVMSGHNVGPSGHGAIPSDHVLAPNFTEKQTSVQRSRPVTEGMGQSDVVNGSTG